MFEWDLGLVSFLGGVTLLIASLLTWMHEKTVVAPATSMLLTWSAALIILSFLPLMGFYHLSVESVFLYVLGACWFAFVAVLVSWIIGKYSKPAYRFHQGKLERLNYQRIMVLWSLVSLFAYPFAFMSIIEYGNTVVEISYNIRRAAVAGEKVVSPMVSNLFVLMGVLSNVGLFGAIRNRVRWRTFTVLVTPFIVFSLVLAGRSGLVSLILGWLVIFAVFSEGFRFRYLVYSGLFLLFVLYFGGIWVKKYDVEGLSLSGVFLVFFEHIFGYLYQGPVLFSEYYVGEISPASSWDFLDSVCHMLSKVGFCTPLNLHQEFNQYGINMIGNVYSIYYSIFPIYGVLGIVTVFTLYASLAAVLFRAIKRKSLFALVTYPAVFAAILLSVYKDTIGYSAYWFVKVAFISMFIEVFFLDRKRLTGNYVKESNVSSG